MHAYTITDIATGERTSIVAPNRDAAMRAYVKQRLRVTRDGKPASPLPPELLVPPMEQLPTNT